MTNETTDLDIHDLCKLFPPMPEDQFGALIDSIRDHGQLTPIVLHEGKILDGRHRYKACINLGIEPLFETIVGAKVRYAGRPAAASPAAGSKAIHTREQETLLARAFVL
jgi:2-oxoglutarate dehydrogenase complex dehydrogenase (E1) component-like enzyme